MNPFAVDFLDAAEAAVAGSGKYMDPRTGILCIDGNPYYAP